MDPTEDIRRQQVEEINASPMERDDLEKQHGQVWDTRELQEDFKVLGFLAPYVGVRKLSTGEKGTLMFQHQPRFYFNWMFE